MCEYSSFLWASDSNSLIVMQPLISSVGHHDQPAGVRIEADFLAVFL